MDRASFRLELLKLTYRAVGITFPTDTAIAEAKKLEEYLYSESGTEKPVRESVPPVVEAVMARPDSVELPKAKNKGR